MRTNRLLSELDGFMQTAVINHENINVENGVSLVFAPLLIEENGVYVCQYSYFSKQLYPHHASSAAVFFITDCPEALDAPYVSDSSSFIFMSCRLDSFANILSTTLLRNKGLIEEKKRQQIEQLWNKLLHTPISENGELVEHLKRLCPYPFHLFIACIVLVPEAAEPSPAPVVLSAVLNELHEFFPETNMFTCGDSIVVLYSQDLRPGKTLSFSYKQFSALLKRNSMCAGISNACRQTNTLPTLYHTCTTSLELAGKIKCQHEYSYIHQYEEYSTYYMIHLCVKEFIRTHGHTDIIYLVHPRVIELYRFDKKNGTDLLDTLFEYLLNGRNATLTAQKLFMHRNTVFNKLSKINSVISLPLDDGQMQFRAMVSCFIVKYYREYLEKQM